MRPDKATAHARSPRAAHAPLGRMAHAPSETNPHADSSPHHQLFLSHAQPGDRCGSALIWLCKAIYDTTSKVLAPATIARYTN
jgi:hypothetical protein